MKVIRRSLQRDKDHHHHHHQQQQSDPLNKNLPSSHPNSNPHSHVNHHLFKQPIRQQTLPTQPFASLAASHNNPSSIGNPPTMVIKAIANYKSNRIVELSFQKGDFFHVVGERDDHLGSWFEASNPATGARGIVPKDRFELFGRSKSTQLALSSSSSSQYNSYPPPRTSAQSSSSPSLLHTPTSAEPFKSVNNHHHSHPAGNKNQPLYGIVQHDFTAERPDELDAKRGEPIIVIAQSNHEWFVAKPIGRLGGPGLIPVTFVQVQDLTTGKTLAPNQVQELIKNAVIPKVEEWKKATAAYKGNSIPLGKFDFTSPSPPIPSGTSTRSASMQNTKPLGHSSGRANHPHGSWPEADGSELPGFGHSRQSSVNSPWNQFSSHTHTQGSPPPPGRYYPDDAESGTDGDGYATVDELRERYGVVVHASVESFHFEQGHYWFHLRAHFSRIADDELHQQTTVLVLYRLYEDFYDFQTALVEVFPDEVDREGSSIRPTILPPMPGPTEDVDELVCAQRVEDLSNYLHELCDLPLHIRESELVYEFLGPREGDVELEGDPGNLGPESRSQMEVEGEVVEYLQRMDSSHGGGRLDDLNESIARLSTGSNTFLEDPYHHHHYHSQHRRQSSQASQPSYASQSSRSKTNGHAGYSERTQDPRTSSTSSTGKSSSPPYPHSMSSEASTLPSASPSNKGSRVTSLTAGGDGDYRGSLGNAGGTNMGTGFLKIKIFQRQADDLIAIRVPTNVRRSELLQRIRDRVGPDAHSIRFRDESGLGYSTGGSVPISANHGARFIGIDNDDDLDRWISSGNRLVLYVD